MQQRLCTSMSIVVIFVPWYAHQGSPHPSSYDVSHFTTWSWFFIYWCYSLHCFWNSTVQLSFGTVYVYQNIDYYIGYYKKRLMYWSNQKRDVCQLVCYLYYPVDMPFTSNSLLCYLFDQHWGFDVFLLVLQCRLRLLLGILLLFTVQFMVSRIGTGVDFHLCWMAPRGQGCKIRQLAWSAEMPDTLLKHFCGFRTL